MVRESPAILAGYLLLPIVTVIGLALFIHCTLELVRLRIEASDYEIIDAEIGRPPRSTSILRRLSRVYDTVGEVHEQAALQPLARLSIHLESVRTDLPVPPGDPQDKRGFN